MKKILLLGEYSGLHTNLKQGLELLGYDVTLASTGDGKKNIMGDIDLNLYSRNSFAKLIEMKNIIKNFKGYDIVQLINPYISHKTGVLFYKELAKQNGKLFLSAAGDDVEFLRFVKNGKLLYTPFDYDLKNNIKLPYNNLFDKYLHRKVMGVVDGIIPVTYSYAESYRTSNYKNKLLPTIPMPINIEEISYNANILKGEKIKIYHASNRANFKGSEIIIEAMQIVEKKYPNDVEMIYAEFLPLRKYLVVMEEANVIIDQCRSYSYGMNSIYSMAKGKIVLSGSEPIALKELGVEECPVLNIKPDVEQIISVLEYLVKNKKHITKLGEKSRAYVEKHHSNKLIAKKYLQCWGLL